MIDLHLHSTASDGTYSPSSLATLASQQGLTAIALTDHDTLAGVSECQKAGETLGLKVLAGIELSTSYEGKELHILGYNVSLTDPDFLAHLKEIQAARDRRNAQTISRLNTLGLDLTLEDLDQGTHPSPVFTRAHFAQALFQKGYVDYPKQAFERYLGQGKPAYVPKEPLEALTSIELIHKVGGVAVLAHPTLYKLNRLQIFSLLQKLVHLGLDGVECYYPSYTPAQSKDFLKFCRNNHLLATGGSDFHGANKPKTSLGTGYGHLNVPDSLLEPLMPLSFFL
ncbi:hypothetical protein CS063_15675 [Sporanaerobium hydrogeniformans]|uniref:Uncharacterized protein n=1 Tax=Sporanaerobium hydrogeniformans TaxID=3072179 RepID=A0AC61DA64_9FIRM|nr:PHP domain-containing protein [Sporanaerobium hydrogeniformans]PHV69437.1 hypothetical protein CS063_15675 [Sporanaerobium hydrogeniformans]